MRAVLFKIQTRSKIRLRIKSVTNKWLIFVSRVHDVTNKRQVFTFSAGLSNPRRTYPPSHWTWSWTARYRHLKYKKCKQKLQNLIKIRQNWEMIRKISYLLASCPSSRIQWCRAGWSWAGPHYTSSAGTSPLQQNWNNLSLAFKAKIPEYCTKKRVEKPP